MEWRQLVMNLESIDPDRLEAVLLESGAQSITLTDAGDAPVLEPAPGETPLWPATCVTALFPADADFAAITGRIRTALGIRKLPPHRVETLADRAWEREWLSRFGPMQFGQHLWVVPSDLSAPDPDAVVVRLDPGLAFGTGTHETTELCLEWLESAEIPGQRVFDFGCGSGILGIAALKLGAASVDAMDIDLQAVTATRQNARRNNVEEALTVSTELPSGSQQYDVVLANILAGTLIEYAADLIGWTRPGGRIVLSGILSGQDDDVRRAFGERVAFDPPARREDWVRLSGSRNEQ
jgi:ribosomal protein L11 methyltransferase